MRSLDSRDRATPIKTPARLISVKSLDYFSFPLNIQGVQIAQPLLKPIRD